MAKKILVVEDEPEFIELLEYNLKREGFSVGTARDGIEAIKKARSLRPDLILLDLLLPELNGLAVCETLRRNPDTAAVPVIVVSALSTQFTKLAGLEAGAVDYITKPFSFRELIARVKRALCMQAA